MYGEAAGNLLDKTWREWYPNDWSSPFEVFEELVRSGPAVLDLLDTDHRAGVVGLADLVGGELATTRSDAVREVLSEAVRENAPELRRAGRLIVDRHSDDGAASAVWWARWHGELLGASISQGGDNLRVPTTTYVLRGPSALPEDAELQDAIATYGGHGLFGLFAHRGTGESVADSYARRALQGAGLLL